VFGQAPNPATASNPAPKPQHRFLVSAHHGGLAAWLKGKRLR